MRTFAETHCAFGQMHNLPNVPYSGMRCLATVISESGFEAQAGRIIVSGYSGVCFEIKFSGRHRGFDSVLFNL